MEPGQKAGSWRPATQEDARRFKEEGMGIVDRVEVVTTPLRGEPVAEVREDMKGGGYVHWLSHDVFVPGTKLYASPQRAEPVAWMVINADGAKSLFDDEQKAHEYAQWAHGPRPVYPLYRMPKK